ncbi:glycine/D-amino acid oxidase-like deaminating enzyme [Labedella gwakjiensis]|uniref:FAD-binding oxidoreductase n=1 Tax=Labedella gwakjiensis TaxID=390269 RepID=A0A2P8GWM2_9MICO|nr:FAD-dependent oxidoreductase [Labedella gwakjiensis]PSL38355.1 glycine/D-amino acid oxidase-like deaminating enzyme [Labedella gwakjiensis]RUQ87114.1 FAD-binding oxidoreductase [Labedella gwakjiensis]
MKRIVVIGAGILGAALARELARDGHDVTVLERTAAASGTSGRGEGNVLVSDKGPGAELELAQLSRSLWPQIARELHEELGDAFPSIEFEPKGGLVVSTTATGAEPLLAFAASQRAAGVRADVIDAAAARALEPHLTDSTTAAIHYPEDAQIQPVIATEAFLASARRSGARVLTGHEVVGAVRDGGGALVGVRARTSSGVEAAFHADAVVNAAGPWGAAVGEALGAPTPVRPRRGMVLVTTRMPHRVFHKVYDADYVGAVGSSAADLQTSSVVESTASGTVLIGSSREQVGFRDEFRSRIVAELARKAILLFPFLAGASLMRTYSGFRPYMPDHLPIIGEDPRVPGLWHANGHEGAGIGLATGTAAMLAALLGGRPAPMDATPFSLSRPTLAPFLAEVVA